MLADRAAPVLAAMLYATVPLPVPDDPDEMVMKLALACAVHAHVDAAVTAIVPVVADALTLVVGDPSLTLQAAALLGVDGAVLLEHANARADEMPRTNTRRASLISRSF